MSVRLDRAQHFVLAVFLAALVAPLEAQQPRRQPPAAEYIKILEDPHRIERLKIGEVVRTLGLKPGDVVADIGSGSGVFSRPMAQAVQPGGKLYAVDIDKELLKHVATTAKEQGVPNILTVLGKEDSPGLESGSLDLAFICDTLHHIDNPQTYLANLLNCLKPGGRVVIIDFLDTWPSGHESMKFTVEDLAKWTQAAGYAKVAEYGVVQGNFFHVYQAASACSQSTTGDQPITVAYFYRIKWGYQEEFQDLFRKNHYPVLEAQVKSGRLVRVEAYTPRFHGDGRSDWNFMTVLVFKNWQAFGDNSAEAEIIKKMYPDQQKFRKEEQRRFELLDAHWDVPLTPTAMR